MLIAGLAAVSKTNRRDLTSKLSKEKRRILNMTSSSPFILLLCIYLQFIICLNSREDGDDTFYRR